MKVIASMMIAGVSAQFYPTGMGGGYPASYGMSTGFGYGGGFGGFGGGFGGYGGGYGGYGGYGDYGRECRKGVTSDDLNGYARCYCDKNHRDEDYCNDGKVGSGDCVVAVPDNLDIRRLLVAPGIKGHTQEVINALDDYYDDIFDDDCVERSQPPANVRRCRKGIYTKDLPSTAACWCDGNHKKDVDSLEDLDDCDKLLTLGGATPEYSPSVNDEFWVALHYEWDEKDVEKACISTTKGPSPAAVYDAEDEGEDFEKYDPNCIERYGGNYGGYGGYGMGGGNFGGFGMGGGYGGFGYNTGFGGNWGMQMQAPATTEGATTTAPQFNFGNQFGNQFGNWGYPTGGFQRWGR